MENKNKYLWILTLVSLTFGSATFNSYAQANDGKVKAKKEEPIRIYGHADIEAAHNINQIYQEEHTSFTPSLIPMDGKQKKLATTLIYNASLKIGFEKKFYVEEEFSKGIIEFAADRKGISIRRLFFETENFSFGLKENNFGNIATFAPVKVIQASWKNKFKDNYTFAFGIEESKAVVLYPKQKAELKGQSEADIKSKTFQPKKGAFPAASANLTYDLSDNFGSIAVSGILRPMSFYDEKTQKTPLIFGWGANIGTKLNLSPKVNTLTANIVVGQGIGSYIYDLNRMGKIEVVDVRLKDKATLNEVEAIMAGGAHASFEHRWSPAFRFTLRAGINHTFKENKDERKNAYKFGVYGGANATYWITRRAAVGAEYIWGGRRNLDNNFKDAHQIKAVATFKI